MKPEPTRPGRSFRRIEARYRGSSSPGWYRADVGMMAKYIKVPVWVYTTWAPFEVNLIGSSSKEHILLVSNTYVAAFALNLAKIALSSSLYPDADDYPDLMRGNFKKFIAEQAYLVEADEQSMQSVIEYLIEYNGKNRALHGRLQTTEEGRRLVSLLSMVSTNCPLFHELGHVAVGVSDYKASVRESIIANIAATVGSNHGIPRLEEEVFCDLFSAVNTIGLLEREGWDSQALRHLFLFVLMACFLCIKTRQLAQAISGGGKPVSLNSSDDILMARYRVVASALREGTGSNLEEPATSLVLPFPAMADSLPDQWHNAARMEVRDPETRTIASILASGYANPALGGFDHVMSSLNEIVSLDGLPSALGVGDIRSYRP